MKILVIGATSPLGQEICARLEQSSHHLRAMTRSAAKLANANYEVVEADALNQNSLVQAMQGQDIVIAGVSGKMILDQAKNIATAAQEAGVKHIYWITGLGIHHEIKGARGMMLNMLLKRMPEYEAAADAIAAGPVSSTLLRLPNITSGEELSYKIDLEGEQPKGSKITRKAVARAVVDLIDQGPDKYANASISITNK
ncbi:NAD(P)-binding oxidoreductase [Limosilactobacillus kribbianus]|uniref:NAD(P)-binding oxidoreductase n=1 Tax=Limosilactobacillus kribbianus TaxID=2982695 RepID=UPI0022650B8E|nr:NAD(P)-binding oxidoreductase [Limosilactobacillus kribbianus]